jgi:hypothetical protein
LATVYLTHDLKHDRASGPTIPPRA